MSSRTLRAVPDESEQPAAPARAKGRGRGRPRTRLSNAVDLEEREMLVVLRRSLAKQIDEGIKPASAFAAVIRQFRDVDRQIRGIDEAAAMADDDDEDDEDEGFDPSDI